MKEQQQKVEEFMNKYELEGTTAFRIMDLVSEVGEIVSDATKSAEYGMSEEELEVNQDEFGDVVFSLCAIANDLGVDLEEAFEEALSKYEERLDQKGDPGSK